MPSQSPSPVRLDDPFATVWSRSLSANISGLSLARERGWLVVWDEAGWLSLLDHAGQSYAQRQFALLCAAAAADDASAYAAANTDGLVWWLAPDMMARWEKRLREVVLAVALDPHGQYLAVSDNRRRLHIFDRAGQDVCQIKTSRPLHHLAFVPAAPLLIGAADYGLIAGFTLDGEIAWRDGPVANVGALSVDGEGKQILLACYSEGIHRYGEQGKYLGRITTTAACRLAAQTFTGDTIIAGGMDKRLQLFNRQGQLVAKHTLEKPPTALALGALGRELFLALENGPLLKLSKSTYTS